MRSDGVLLLAMLAGCSRESLPLVEPQSWEEASKEDDPFDDRPDAIDCAPSAWGLDTDPLSLEVDTGLCDYLTAVQPTRETVRKGDLVRVHASHDDLLSETPAEGHLEIRIGTWTVLDRRVAIPTTAADLVEEVVAPDRFPAGTPVWLHVHNHGDNTWNVYSLHGGPP